MDIFLQSQLKGEKNLWSLLGKACHCKGPCLAGSVGDSEDCRAARWRLPYRSFIASDWTYSSHTLEILSVSWG